MSRYILYRGRKGSEFGTGTALPSNNAASPLKPIVDFLRTWPQVHDLSWSTDDGDTFVVKRVDREEPK